MHQPIHNNTSTFSLEAQDATLLAEEIPFDPQVADSLQGCFLISSLLFRYPEPGLYHNLKLHLNDFTDFFQKFAGRGLELMPLEELQAEYIRLFVNNQGFVPVVPYASYHLDPGKLLAGNSLQEIRTLMLQSGLVLDEAQSELEDHLAVLLEYGARILGELSLTEASVKHEAALRVNVLFQLCTRYLQPVSTRISDLINAHARYDFYKVAGESLQNFLLDFVRHWTVFMDIQDEKKI